MAPVLPCRRPKKVYILGMDSFQLCRCIQTISENVLAVDETGCGIELRKAIIDICVLCNEYTWDMAQIPSDDSKDDRPKDRVLSGGILLSWVPIQDKGGRISWCPITMSAPSETPMSPRRTRGGVWPKRTPFPRCICNESSPSLLTAMKWECPVHGSYWRPSAQVYSSTGPPRWGTLSW